MWATFDRDPAGSAATRFLSDETGTFCLNDLQARRCLATHRDALRGRSVLLAVRAQRAAVLALVELHGLARRVLLCPPDLAPQHLPAVLAAGEVDCVIGDAWLAEYGDLPFIQPAPEPRPAAWPADSSPHPTEWVLFTSGTTGAPKLALHTLESLSGHLPRAALSGEPPVWSTFYDVRRYGGMQILLRALLGGTSLVLSSPDELPAAFLARAGAAGVTHILGTPSHWRRALMSGEAGRISPDYVRLSGEIADQAILDRLRATYPASRVIHAFASTEAGVGFEVDDGLAGFPASVMERAATLEGQGVEIRIVEGSLQIRSSRQARCYLNDTRGALTGPDGFVDTGDLVERRNNRYYFVGRSAGIINVGGQKVHPEEVEAVLNRFPGVDMALVRSRRNPITGSVVTAEVVMRHPHTPDDAGAVIGKLLGFCRVNLPGHKVPATIRIVPALEVSVSGKIMRTHA